MLTVAILINGQPLVAKNAINQAETDDAGRTKYLTDAGEVIWHDRDAGAVQLAQRLLTHIRNDDKAVSFTEKQAETARRIAARWREYALAHTPAQPEDAETMAQGVLTLTGVIDSLLLGIGMPLDPEQALGGRCE